MSTSPSLVTTWSRIVPVWSPAAWTMSKLFRNGWPSIATSNMRCPARLVQLQRLAKYSRTSTTSPAGTGNAQCISPPSSLLPGSHRSVLKIALGVVDGTVLSTFATGDQPAVLLPELRYGDGSVCVALPVRAVVDGADRRATGVDAVQHGAVRGVGEATRGVDPARQASGCDSSGSASPPASGKNASFLCR